jgi:glutathione S-transferase
MRLYSGPLSLFTGKVRIALDEKGLDYELVSVPFSRAKGYEPKHAEVLRLNPKAQVPVLVDGDLALYDSTLILEYLEDRHPEPPLLPADPVGRARCRQLEAAADEILFPFVFELIQEVFYRSEQERDGARVVRARQAITDHYAGLERGLDSGSYLGGDLSIADIGYFLTLTFAANLGAPLADAQPKLRAWYERLLERSAFRREMARLLTAAQS